MSSQPLRLGIAGLGTVGCGVIEIIQNNAALLKQRTGRDVEIICVSAKRKDQKRDVETDRYEWVDDARDMAARDDLDAIVELIGGSEGVAYDLVKSALSNGISVVTANKALLAHHGYELAVLAEENNATIAYEASVAGGVPVIKAMREGFAANNYERIYGILNGTCNYILSEMRLTGRGFDDVLKEAQEQGYAEADPSFDIDGIDAGHKLALLVSLAFGTKPDFESLEITGVGDINKTDIDFADELGYRIKLLAIARRENGKVMQILEPCLVPSHSPLGMIEDVYNAVFIHGDAVETPLLTGKGAGRGPTASSVVADIMDLARGYHMPVFGIPAEDLKAPDFMDNGLIESRYYLRLTTLDVPGVLADITRILKEQEISIEAILQRGRDPGQPVPIVITTHETTRQSVKDALSQIEALEHCIEKPHLIRIDETE